ncbi:hypothetical protein ACJX0J_041395, partial [Zea mays]
CVTTFIFSVRKASENLQIEKLLEEIKYIKVNLHNTCHIVHVISLMLNLCLYL